MNAQDKQREVLVDLARLVDQYRLGLGLLQPACREGASLFDATVELVAEYRAVMFKALAAVKAAGVDLAPLPPHPCPLCGRPTNNLTCAGCM